MKEPLGRGVKHRYIVYCIQVSLFYAFFAPKGPATCDELHHRARTPPLSD